VEGITTGMKMFMEGNPRLKYAFFGGKGGVGKTALSAAAALWSARRGGRTLLASTNPVHGLSDLFGQDLLGKPRPVCSEERYHALEIDTSVTTERSKQQTREKIDWFLKTAGITTRAEEFIESAGMNPSFEESAMFEAMMDLIFADEYDFYVFDTGPFAITRRLLGMSKVYSLWVERMLKSREAARSLREALSFSKKQEKDPLMEYLTGFRERIANGERLLFDKGLTSLFCVTLPESLPIAVATRLIDWSCGLGIPVGGVIVNGVIEKGESSDRTAEFVRNRIAIQEERLAEIRSLFGDRVRAVTPLFETEVRGGAMLERMSEYLFA